VESSNANLFKKGLIENDIVGVIKRRNASLFKKGLSENDMARRDQAARLLTLTF
jgi:hypothetical protein